MSCRRFTCLGVTLCCVTVICSSAATVRRRLESDDGANNPSEHAPLDSVWDQENSPSAARDSGWEEDHTNLRAERRRVSLSDYTVAALQEDEGSLIVHPVQGRTAEEFVSQVERSHSIEQNEDTTTIDDVIAANHADSDGGEGERPVLVSLVSDNFADIWNLCSALRSTKFLPDMQKNTEGKLATPVIVFHEGNLKGHDICYLTKCAASRPISFSVVDFNAFPSGFDPQKEHAAFSKRSQWGYVQMCRLFISGLWDNPVMTPYTTAMRLDSDSCYTKEVDDNKLLPSMSGGGVVYHNNTVSMDEPYVVEGLREFALSYVKENRLTVKNPKLWRMVEDSSSVDGLPMFENHFEVVRVDFMRRPEVRAWHESLTEREPFGVLRKRWGDAPIRFLTMAMFADEDMLEQGDAGRVPEAYRHKGCRWHQNDIFVEDDSYEMYAQCASGDRRENLLLFCGKCQYWFDEDIDFGNPGVDTCRHRAKQRAREGMSVEEAIEDVMKVEPRCRNERPTL